MRKHLARSKLVLLILLFSLLVPTSISLRVNATSGEDGEWIDYPFVYPSMGTVYAVVGDDCIGVAKTPSDTILFFDINKSVWTELKLNVSQVIYDVKAKGHTVFAYTYYFLVGYSSYTCSYNVIPYKGTLLNTVYGSAYSCGKNLALFVTNETMYVFDSKLGRWQEYSYELPADYSSISSSHCVMDDYVLVVLGRGQGQPKNLVYSLHTHSFNQLENGVLTVSILDHGFAGHYRFGDSDNVLVLGYSAFTNGFSSPSTSGLGATFATVAGSISIQSHGEHTAYAISFFERVSDEEIRGHFFGYDTYLGSWSYETLSFIVGQERWSQNPMAGGRFLVDTAVLNDGEVYKLIIYSGVTGNWSVVTEPDLTYDSLTSSILCGGESLVVYDVDSAWGYSLLTEQSSMISASEPRTLFWAEGKDYCIFCRFSDSSTQMTMYIYNSQNNNWTVISGLPKGVSTTSYSVSEHVFTYCSDTSPTSETVFYSSFLDKYEICNFPAGSSVSMNAKYSLAYAFSNAKSYLFDAQRGNLYTFDFSLGMYSLGDFAACFFNTTSQTTTLYGYSALSGKFTNLTTTETVYVLPTNGFVGLISNTAYSKYYAFNGLKDSWVELLPSGTLARSPIVGEKTALIVRSDRVYAFDPNGRMGTYNYLIEYEGNLYPVSISTNSTSISNFGFNQSERKISFNVTGSDGTIGFCNLTLPKTLVQNLWHGDITILVDGQSPTDISILSDETYTYIYFTYNHSEHKVIIIPEFSPLIILLLLMETTLTTLIAIIKPWSKPKNPREGERVALLTVQIIRFVKKRKKP